MFHQDFIRDGAGTGFEEGGVSSQESGLCYRAGQEGRLGSVGLQVGWGMGAKLCAQVNPSPLLEMRTGSTSRVEGMMTG